MQSVRVSPSHCGKMTSQSFHSDFMTLGGIGEIYEVIVTVLSLGRLFPNGAVKDLVHSHFK